MVSPYGSLTGVSALERENLQLRRAVQELSILNDLALAIGASHDAAEIMHTIVHRSLAAVGAQQGVITLVEADDGRTPPGAEPPQRMRTLIRTTVSSSSHVFHLNEAIAVWMCLNKRPLVVSDAASDDSFFGGVRDAGVRSLLSVPLLVKGDLVGTLTVFNKGGDAPFDANDERLLAIIAAQSAQVVENARLYEEEKKLSGMREQVRLAAHIQEHLLPASLPAVPGFQLAGRSIAAQQVGGDYYDAIPMSGGLWNLCVGDVSGKGLPASLLMASVQAMMRLLATADASPRDAMKLANRLLHRSTPPEKFVTFFTATLDPRSSNLTYCNAGHNAPLLVARDGTHRLRTRGIALGMVPDFAFDESTTHLLPGDVVLLFSDGVTEAIDAGEEEFGEERLMRLVTECRLQPASEIVEHVLDAVRRHAGTQPQYDDITLLVIRRDG